MDPLEFPQHGEATVRMVRCVLVNDPSFRVVIDLPEKTYHSISEAADVSETDVGDHVIRMAVRRYRSGMLMRASRKESQSSVRSIYPFQRPAR